MAKTTSPEKKLLNEALKGFVERLEKTEQFVLAQAPDICKQIVKEIEIVNKIDIAMGIFWTLAGMVGAIISLANGILHNYVSESGYEHTDPTRYLFFLVASCVALLYGICSIYGSAKWLLFIKNCPKLLLLREFKKLVK